MPRLIPISTIATQCCPSYFLPLKFLAPPAAAPPFGAFGPGKICCKAWSSWVYIYQYDPMCQQVLMGAELALWSAFVWRWWVMEFEAFLEILMANPTKLWSSLVVSIARISIQNEPFHCRPHDLRTVGLWKCMPLVDNPSTCLPLALIPFGLFGATHLQHPPSIVRAHWWEQLITSHLCQLWLLSWALPVWRLSSFGMPELLPQWMACTLQIPPELLLP